MAENKISQAEQEIMLYIWRQNRSAALKEVVLYFQNKKNWAKSTTHTLLARLCSKEYLECDKQAGTNIYSALINQRQYLCDYSTQTVDTLFGGSMKKFLHAYYNINTPTQEELDNIKDLIGSLKAK